MVKRLKVFEAGAGKGLRAVLRKAYSSEIKRKGREFIVVDEKINKKPLMLDVLIRRALGKMPKNVQIAETCATKLLLQTVPNSQDLIFASYLTNNLKSEGFSCVSPNNCRTAFLLAAKRALTPGGRLVLVQDKVAVPYYEQIGQSMGLQVHSITIPPAKALKSDSEHIRLRATPKKRIKFMKEHYRLDPNSDLVQAWIKRGIIKEPEEFAQPTIISLRKSRKGGSTRVASEIPIEILEKMSELLGIPVSQMKILTAIMQ